uniref:Myb-related transcription factor, partner of profilin-like n=1 Tax=Fundulus heteroclitus TaxID=8078 RepID=A0A3Q2NQQ3_FUNHE
MESVGEESGRKRKRKFEAIELKVLVEEANTHIGELRQKQLCLSRRNAIWDSICAKVNAVGKTKRSADEVKRRWQDFRRRTREELSRKKSLAQKQRSQKGSPDFPETLCEGQVLGIEGYDFLQSNTINQESLSDVQQAPPSSSDLLTSVKVPEESRRSPVTDDIYQELLYQQIHQTDALETIAQEVRAVSSVARAVRGQTRAILAHTRQLVGALSGLTMAINALAAAGRSSGDSGPSTVPPENEEEGGEDAGGHQSGLRKRKAPTKNSDL